MAATTTPNPNRWNKGNVYDRAARRGPPNTAHKAHLTRPVESNKRS